MSPYHQQLRNILEHTTPRLETLDTEDWQQRAAPDKWSKQEILGHLIDSAYHNHLRFVYAPRMPNLVFDGYPQPYLVSANRYQQREPGELIRTWEQANLNMAYMLEGLPVEVINRETTDHNFHTLCMYKIDEGAPSSLGYLVWDYLAHMEHHLIQLLDGYERLTAPFDQQ